MGDYAHFALTAAVAERICLRAADPLHFEEMALGKVSVLTLASGRIAVQRTYCCRKSYAVVELLEAVADMMEAQGAVEIAAVAAAVAVVAFA